ncbi:GntR family transcriptional regulator [Labrys monachus]|uniref:GntR family transcriptional regulator n=1 Tax=Labrys monachus TaxID=217067 RepID=A0ABU0FLA2_9HYPH|nr:GntR family transcriptional regulator [Labrys monachus]MDQ0395380.1 GntR family transcriptional regulator [Labrys monachus]
MSWNATPLSHGPVPLWFQIAERLRAAIAAGTFSAGDVLPSEAELHAAFGVSRTTARASLERLRQEGLISRHAGRGSILLKPKVEQPANQLASFSEDMSRRGLRASYATASAAPAPLTSEAAEALGLAQGAEAFCIHRLLQADGEPMGLSVSWLAPEVLATSAPPTVADLDAGSLYAWLARHCGARITGGHEYIEAAGADAATARSLGVARNAPILVARRRSWGPDGRPVEYAVMRYRADRYRFSVDLARA